MVFENELYFLVKRYTTEAKRSKKFFGVILMEVGFIRLRELIGDGGEKKAFVAGGDGLRHTRKYNTLYHWLIRYQYRCVIALLPGLGAGFRTYG